MTNEFITDPKTGQTFQVDDSLGTESQPSGTQPAPSPAVGAETNVQVEQPKAAAPEQQAVVETSSQAAPAASESEELTPEEQKEFESLLESIMGPRIGAAVHEAQKGWQSAADEKYSALEKQLKQVQDDLRTKQEEAELADLDPEERAALLEKRGLERRKAELDEYAQSVDEFYKENFMVALITEFSDYGVTREQLQVFAEPEQMEAYAESVKSAVERALESAGLPTGTPVTATRARPGAAVVAEPAVPAGVSAPSDAGAAGAPVVAQKLEEGTGLTTLAKNLSKLGWDTVRVP